MIVEPMVGGYWLASGHVRGRLVLAEGNTRDEAFDAWFSLAAGVWVAAIAALKLPRRTEGLMPSQQQQERSPS